MADEDNAIIIQSPEKRIVNLLDTWKESEALNSEVEKEDNADGDTTIHDLVPAQDMEKLTETVRFQYDGVLKMEVTVPSDDLFTCELGTNYTKAPGANSFHVVEYMHVILVRIDLLLEIVEGKVYCDQVDEEKYQIQIESNLGMDRNGGFSEFYADLPNEESRAFIAKCSTIAPPGEETAHGVCTEEITHNPAGGQAGLSAFLTVGRPNIIKPFTKNVNIKVFDGEKDVHHRADFFVQGPFSKGKGNSFALPTHQPLMILRDPPGKAQSSFSHT